MSTPKRMTTRQKILHAAADLFSQSGYTTVTTKEIAGKAGVSEMTLYRYFGNKLSLFENVIDVFSFGIALEDIFKNKLEMDLEKDLLLISQTYRDFMFKNRRVILIGIREFAFMEDSDYPFIKYPKILKILLKDYFALMQQSGKVLKGDPEQQALHVIILNFGTFMAYALGMEDVTDVSYDKCMRSNVDLLVKSLKNDLHPSDMTKASRG